MKFKSLGKDDNVLEVGLERALEVLNKPAGKRGARGSSVVKKLGKHPDTGEELNVLDGRYGPYFKYGKKNISLPKDVDVEKFSVEDALELIKKKAKK